jgi:HAD superfamily hydrolase (TIGR01490 family)
MNRIILIDFDGTITKNDSFLRFIHFAVGDIKFSIGLILLSPILILYKLKLIPNYIAKQKMISYFFKGYSEDNFRKIANEYSLNYIDKILRPKAMERIEWHKKQGHKIVVISASIDYWLRSWCDKNNLELIATQLEIKNNIITGNLLTKNCYGVEKINRIKELYNLDNFEYIYAYGDSFGDKEMLDIADESFYKPFR